MKHSVIFVALAAAGLGACSPNQTGVAAGSSAEASSKSDTSTAKQRQLSAEQKFSTAAKIPAATLIGQALLSGDGDLQGSAQRTKFMVPGVPGIDMDAIMTDSMAEAVKASVKAGEIATDCANHVYSSRICEVAKGGAGDSEIEGIVRDEDGRAKLTGMIAGCVSPLAGWEVDPMRQKDSARTYITGIAADCQFTNFTYTKIAEKLGQNVMRDEEAAHAEIKKIWLELPLAQLQTAAENAKTAAANEHYTVDLASGRGVHFYSDRNDFKNDGVGFEWSQAGMPKFGRGMIDGKAVEFAVASASGISVSKSNSVKSDSSSTAGSKAGADVNLK